MTDEEVAWQRAIHDALEAVLPLDDGHLLTGWTVAWESAAVSTETSAAGSFYGPRGMTTWRALGLLEWARRFCLCPDGESDE